MAGYGVYASQQKVEMSDLAMANVKALASGESGSFNYWWDSVDCRICYVGGYWLGCILAVVATPASRKTKRKKREILACFTGKHYLCSRLFRNGSEEAHPK